MGARTCGRCVLSVDHLRLFLESRAQLNFPKSLSLELVQGSPVSFLDGRLLAKCRVVIHCRIRFCLFPSLLQTGERSILDRKRVNGSSNKYLKQYT